MANEELNKFSSNLKVPPLKIVLSSHQNNTVVNLGNIDDSQSSFKKDANSNEHNEHFEFNRRNGSSSTESGDRQHKKGVKTDRGDSELGQTSSRSVGFSPSSSSSSSSSDRSTSTTPSSESESLASNSTIISDQQVKSKVETKDDVAGGRHEKGSRSAKLSALEKNSTGTSSQNKRSHDNINEQFNEATATSTKDHILNANQRITRSSQRAAQQNKSENLVEGNGEESNLPDNQEKIIHESARKAKRRKGEVQETEQDDAQTISQLTIKMANIHPADYQLPTHNSIELYRDIRKRPYKKLMKLSHIQPKVPHGFKDFLINSGPYLLDGNKLGGGLSGSKLDNINNGYQSKVKNHSTSRAPLRMKMSNLLYGRNPSQSSQLRHSSYIIPKPLEAPVALPAGSPLNELFQDQEKARQQMRIQHLKERERAILAAEQEILRAYNKAAIADIKQKLHLSACTYFYYQEKYHYLNEKSGANGKMVAKEVPHSQDNSFLCIEGGETTKSNDNNINLSKESKNFYNEDSEEKVRELDVSLDEEKRLNDTPNVISCDTKDLTLDVDNINADTTTTTTTTPTTTTITTSTTTTFTTTSAAVVVAVASIINTTTTTTSDKSSTEESNEAAKPNIVDMEVHRSDESTKEQNDVHQESIESKIKITADEGDNLSLPKPLDFQEKPEQLEKQVVETSEIDQQVKNLDPDSDNSLSELPTDKIDTVEKISDDDLKAINKGVFVNQLQDIDDKWDSIKRDMLVRHRNEADSLYAVQTLEWEWKAKEIGACDVRVSLKIEPEFVPKGFEDK